MPSISPGLDIGPHINDLTIEASKFTPTCNEVVMTVDAYSPDNEQLYYRWEVISTPDNAQYTLEQEGEEARFMSKTIGDFELKVTVFELRGPNGEAEGLSTSLSFPIHVTRGGDTECCLSECCS